MSLSGNVFCCSIKRDRAGRQSTGWACFSASEQNHGPVLAIFIIHGAALPRITREPNLASTRKEVVKKHIFAASLFLCFLIGTSGCHRENNPLDRNWSWSMIAETDNQSLLFIDPGAISYPDSASVLVWVKYVPSKSRAVAGMRQLSKELGGGRKQNEYTISQWHFSCVNETVRCVRLVHFRDKDQIASYSYPSGEWTGPPKGDTKIVYDTVCATWSQTKRQEGRGPQRH
jgi:hypothetical protein